MNKYIPRFLPAEVFAKQLTIGVKEQDKKYKLITEWANRNLVYDYVKAAKVARLRGVAPDPVSCWTTHRGICQDIANLVVIMLRAVGIRCFLCIGHADNNYHAWVQAYIGNKICLYDHENQDRKKIKYVIEKSY